MQIWKQTWHHQRRQGIWFNLLGAFDHLDADAARAWQQRVRCRGHCKLPRHLGWTMMICFWESGDIMTIPYYTVFLNKVYCAVTFKRLLIHSGNTCWAILPQWCHQRQGIASSIMWTNLKLFALKLLVIRNSSQRQSLRRTPSCWKKNGARNGSTMNGLLKWIILPWCQLHRTSNKSQARKETHSNSIFLRCKFQDRYCHDSHDATSLTSHGVKFIPQIFTAHARV